MGKEFDQVRVKVEKITKSKIAEDPLKKIPKNKRVIYEEVFGLIYESAPNRVTAKSLVDKIIARISGVN